MISAAMGRVRPEMKSSFSSLTRFGIGRLRNFLATFYLSEVIGLFRFACKMRFQIFWKGYSPMKFFFIDETPEGTSVNQSASLDASCVQIGSVVCSVARVTKKKKKRQGKVKSICLYFNYMGSCP
jgi:hypothetical protein